MNSRVPSTKAQLVHVLAQRHCLGVLLVHMLVQLFSPLTTVQCTDVPHLHACAPLLSAYVLLVHVLVRLYCLNGEWLEFKCSNNQHYCLPTLTFLSAGATVLCIGVQSVDIV